MGKHIKILLAGFLISFLGAMPIGTINSTAFQIADSHGLGTSFKFALTVVAIELIVVQLTLAYTSKIQVRSKLFLYVLPITIFLLFYLAFSSFVSLQTNQQIIAGMTLFPNIKSMILLGLLISVMNPMQILFWMGWNSILLERRMLVKKASIYASYTVGIGLGTMTGLAIYSYAGSFIFQNYTQYRSIIVLTMGCFYLSLSFYLIFLLYKNHLKLKIQ